MMQRHLDGSVPARQPTLLGLFSLGSMALPQNGTWSLPVEPGATLVLQAGKAWVTFEGDAEDHVLEAPAAFTAPQHGRVAVQALSPVRFAVEAPARRAA